MRTRVLIVDDHKIVREGLRALLENSKNYEIVAEADNGQTAKILARKYKPDIIVMDIDMPILNGVEATIQITEELNNVRIIALSMYSEKRYIRRIFKAGAWGYLLKDCAFEELEFAFSSILNNKRYISPDLSDALVEDFLDQNFREESRSSSLLTSREREILQLIAEGFSIHHISQELFLSSRTVEAHRYRIMQKLNIPTMAGLTKFAIREGITSSGLPMND